MTDRHEQILDRAADILSDIHNARKNKHTTSSPEEPQVGYFVPAGTEICPHCGDQNFNKSDRLCISCNHHHPKHDRFDCEQFCQRKPRQAPYTAEQAAEHLVKTMEAMTMTEEEITTAILRAGGQEQP